MKKSKKRLGHQGTQCWKSAVLRLHDQRGRVFFASMSSRRLCGQCAGNPEMKKGNNFMSKGRSCANDDCHIVRANKSVRS